MPEKKRLGFIDLAKALAFFLVVCGHTFRVEDHSPFRAIIYSFHMPLYFVLAGYTFSHKPMRKVAVDSAKRLIIPYVLFFVTATMIPTVFIWITDGRKQMIADLFLRLLYVAGDGHEILDTGAIWTLVALYLSRVILNALFGLFERWNVKLPVQGIVCAACALVGYLTGSVFEVRLPLALDIALIGVFFMWCGYAMRQTGIIEKRFSPVWLLIPLAIWIAEISLGLPEWKQSLSMLGRQYPAFPLPILGAISAGFLLIKLCYFIEKPFEAAPATALSRKTLGFLEHLGQQGMRLYLIHCLDFFLGWSAVSFPLFGSTSLTAAIVRIAFDILILVLFEHV